MQTWFRIVLCAGLLLSSAPATAGSLYYWVTEEGTHAYSDDLKRVPNRYREQAQKSALPTLESYERWTPSDATASGSYASRLAGNLERLRATNAQPGQVAPGSSSSVLSLQLGSANSGLQFGVPAGGGTGEPVIVQSARTRLPGDRATRNVTFVQQGDQTLAMIVDQDNDSEVIQLPTEAVEQLLERR